MGARWAPCLHLLVVLAFVPLLAHHGLCMVRLRGFSAPTMHRSAMRKTVVLSSCEAELNPAVLCAQDMLYQINMLESIGLKLEVPMILEMDNNGAVNRINSFRVGGCMQHINVKQCFLWELTEAKVIVVKWIPSSENEADLFTKNFDGPLFKRYAKLFLAKDHLAVRGVTLSKWSVRRYLFST